MIKKNDLFCAVMVKGILGGVIGIISGFALGLIIWGLMYQVNNLSSYSDDFYREGGMLKGIEVMSMGIGAILGVIFGSQAALKENSREKK